MKERKLFYLLKHLSSEEFKGLKQAVYTPFFNSNKRLPLLYEALRPDFPNFEDTLEYCQKLFKKVYPGEVFDKAKQQKIFTAFTRVIEEYLLFSDLRKEDLELKKLKVRLYAKRQMLPYFERETNSLAAVLEASPFRDLEHYEKEIFLHNALYFNPLKDKYDLKDQSLNKLTDALDHYFVLAKMRYGISVKSRERILAKPGIWRFNEAMEKETHFMSDSILFQLYRYAFLMLSEDKTFSFEAYETLLFENIDQFRSDSRILFFAGLNYVVRQVNRGVSAFSRKAFEWYLFGLEKGLLLENGLLTEVTFGNIVIYGCREGEFEWTKNFMEQYSQYLKETYRQDILMFNLSLWNFYQQKFDDVLSIFFNYHFSTAYIPKARLITIRTLFELFLINQDYFELLISNIKAYESFILRDEKFNSKKWIPHLNCIKIIRRSTKMILDFESGEKVHQWMSNEIAKRKNVVSKKWLLEKSEQVRVLKGY